MVRARHRQSRLVLADGPRHRPGARRSSPRQPAGESRTAGLPGARSCVDSHYDIKHLFRLILNSSTYQLSPIPQAEARPQHFAAYPLRRLDAEVLIDALNQITGTGETYSSSIPEPYTFMPDDQRSIALPDGSISSAFLELFGRPSRDIGTGGRAQQSRRAMRRPAHAQLQPRAAQDPAGAQTRRHDARYQGSAGTRKTALPDHPLPLSHG